MNKKINLFVALFLFIGIGIADQLSKQYMLHNAKERYYINALIALTPPTMNKGIAGGMLQTTSPIGFILLTFVILLIIAGFVLYTYRSWQRGESILGESLVLSGALSNVIDRILYYGVIDFILLHYAQWSFPIFNIADMAITIGIGIMFFGALKHA